MGVVPNARARDLQQMPKYDLLIDLHSKQGFLNEIIPIIHLQILASLLGLLLLHVLLQCLHKLLHVLLQCLVNILQPSLHRSERDPLPLHIQQQHSFILDFANSYLWCTGDSWHILDKVRLHLLSCAGYGGSTRTFSKSQGLHIIERSVGSSSLLP